MSSLNGLIKRPHREGHKLTRIAIGSNTNLPENLWCYACCYYIFLSRRLYHLGSNCVPYYKWFQPRPSFKCIHAQGTPGIKVVEDEQKKGKLDSPGQTQYFVGYGSTTKIILAYKPKTNRVVCAVHFKFDTTYSSILGHSLLETFRNIMKPIKLEDLKDIKFNSVPNIFPESDKLTIVLPLSHPSSQLNIQINDDPIFNLPYIKTISPRHKQKRILPDIFQSNFYIIGCHDDQPITSAGIQEYITYLSHEALTEVMFQLVKRKKSLTQTDYEDLRAAFEQV